MNPKHYLIGSNCSGAIIGGAQCLAAIFYWSSTEATGGYAYSLYIEDGSQNPIAKGRGRGIRAVRAINY